MQDQKNDWITPIQGLLTGETLRLAFSDEISDLFDNVNKEYIYWDKFKYLNLNSNISTELAWSCVRFRRFCLQKKLPIQIGDTVFLNFCMPEPILAALHHFDRVATSERVRALPSSQRFSLLRKAQMAESIASWALEGGIFEPEQAFEALEKVSADMGEGERWLYNNYSLLMELPKFLTHDFDQNLVQKFYRILCRQISPQFLESELERSSESDLFKLWMNQFSSLQRFLNEDADSHHPIIKASLGYFCMVYFRPFGRLSGPMGRAFLYWYLLKKNYSIAAYFSLSAALQTHGHSLNRSIQYVIKDHGDLTYFIMQLLNILAEALRSFENQMGLLQKRENAGQNLFQHLPNLNARQHALLMEALDHPEAAFTIKGHRQKHHVVYETARMDLLRLEKQGLLTSQMRAQEFVFMPVADLNQRIKGELPQELKQ